MQNPPTEAPRSPERTQSAQQSMGNMTGEGVGDSSPRDRASTAPSALEASSDSALPGNKQEDEELRRATAMAMAIQNNPNMSMEEIQKMLAKQEAEQQQAQQQQQQSNKKPVPAGALASTAVYSSTSALPTSSSNNGLNNTKKGRSFRFDGSRFAAVRAAVTGQQSTTQQQQQQQSTLPDGSSSHDVDPHVIQQQQQQQSEDGAGVQQGDATATTSSAAVVVGTKEKKTRLLDGHRIKAALNRDKSKESSAAAAAAATGANKSETIPEEDTGTPATSRRLMLRSNKGRTPPPSPMKPGGAGGVAVDAAASSGGSGTAGTTSTRGIAIAPGSGTNVSDSSGAPPPPPKTPTNMLQHLLSNRQIARSKAPIRLTEIAWKRRGGMGKFATSGGAWERRRIELQGTTIYYYAKDETDDMEDATAPEPPIGSGAAAADTASVGDTTRAMSSYHRDSGGISGREDDVGEGVVVAKQSNWFENALFTANNTPEDPNSPRGALDLAKEKASVHAALAGHGGGSPSPFVISIKVRGETKWKFCFDQHTTQMEWLAALTDIVVQNSLDMYNAQLLEASDPSSDHFQGGGGGSGGSGGGLTNTTPLSMLQQHTTGHATVKSPPGTTPENAGTRLWQMQPYTISSAQARGVDVVDDQTHNDDDVDDDDDDLDGSVIGGGESDLVAMPTLEQHEQAQIVAHEEATRTWMLPQHNFFYLTVTVNVAVTFARISILSMQGFWYLIVLTNVLLYFCLVQVPDWKSVLEYVRATPVHPKHKAAAAAAVAASLRKSIAAAGGDPAAAASIVGSAQLRNTSLPGYKPVAGTTAMKIKNPTDLPVNDKNEVFPGWRNPPGEGLMVRSHGYMLTKTKIPSPGELYECIKCDIFEAPTRYPDMAPRVQLPTVTFNDNDNNDPNFVKTWRSPDMFVVSIALPTDPPKLGRTGGDGGGYTITLYLAMKQETRDILRRVTADDYDPIKEEAAELEAAGGDIQKSKVNAVRLLEEWVRRAPTDPKWFSRFKVVPNAHNLQEIGMPGWISKYNGKPFLIKRPGVTGFIHQHPELSVFEFDISLHPFPYLARQAICFLKENFFKKVLVTFGFVIEGRADDELPECIIGCLQLCYPDPVYGIQAEDFFGGTSRKSS